MGAEEEKKSKKQIIHEYKGHIIALFTLMFTAATLVAFIDLPINNVFNSFITLIFIYLIFMVFIKIMIEVFPILLEYTPDEQYIINITKIVWKVIIWLFINYTMLFAISLFRTYHFKAFTHGGWLYLEEFYFIILLIALSFIAYLFFLFLYSKKEILILISLQGILLVIASIIAWYYDLYIVQPIYLL